MATTSISSNTGDVSNYSSRMITITVTGTSQQSARLANQIISVPYNRLSQAMRNIRLSGGKVVDVSLRPMSADTVEAPPSPRGVEINNAPLIVEDRIEASPSGEEVVDAESHQTDASGRAKRQNVSHGSKKKKR